MTPDFWKNRRVLVTGHTGFKGAWLALWLVQMGARVSGLSIDRVSDPDLWSLLDLSDVSSHLGDIRDPETVQAVLGTEKPDVVFHLAAQSLVRRSYGDPLDTFSTNIQGTAVLLDAIRRGSSVAACVVVTSDKCYENREQSAGYVETDAMGGHDPYSASKGCAELITASMRNSFFAPFARDGHTCAIATARAGNVIGGGDWSDDRLIPDIVRGCLGPAGGVVIRAPKSVRPWQHVMEPLRGYMMLAEALVNGTPDAATGWNFGPDNGDERQVIDVANAIVAGLGQGKITVQEDASNPHEAKLLCLDNSKARGLGWRPVMGFDDTVKMTADWYGSWSNGGQARGLCHTQIEQFLGMIGE